MKGGACSLPEEEKHYNTLCCSTRIVCMRYAHRSASCSGRIIASCRAHRGAEIVRLVFMSMASKPASAPNPLAASDSTVPLDQTSAGLGTSGSSSGSQDAEELSALHARASVCDWHSCSALKHCCGRNEDLPFVHNPVEIAVILVNNAWHGREPAPPTPASLWARQIYHAQWYRYFSLAILVTYMALALVELPSDTLTQSVALHIFEAIILSLFVLDLRLQWLYYGRDIFFTKKWTVAKVVLVPLFAISLALHVGSAYQFPHITRALRPIFLIERMRGVRRVAANMMVAVPKMLYVGFLMWMNIIFFGVIFFVFLAGVEGKNVVTGEMVCPPVTQLAEKYCSTYASGCRDYFSTLDNSIYQLFILSTTANFPDVMLPAYECNRWWGWLFVVFIVISIYLLFNLTLAVAFTAFSSVTQNKVVDQTSKSLQGYAMAFHALVRHQHSTSQAHLLESQAPSSDGQTRPAQATKQPVSSSIQDTATHLQRATWVQFFLRLKPRADPYLAGVLFDCLDTQRQRQINCTTFQRLVLYFARINIKTRQSRAPHPSQMPPPSRTHATGSKQRTPPNGSSLRPLVTDSPVPRGIASMETEAEETTTGGLDRSQVAWDARRDSRRRARRTCACNCDCIQASLISSVGTYVGSGVPIASAKAASAPRFSQTWFAYLLFNAWATVFFDTMVLVNGVTILTQLQLIGTSSGNSNLVNISSGIQYFSLAVFLFEVTAKVLALGPVSYWRMSIFQRTDIILAALSIVALSLETTSIASGQLASAITMVRMTRMLRGARVLPGFTVTMSSFADAIPLLMQFVFVYVSVLYSFAIIALELYNGKLNLGDPALRNTSYEELKYWTLNFDSLSDAMMTLFHTSVVNNAPVVFDGLQAATNSKWPRVFFILYYTVTVLLVLNVVIAFFIESFSVQREKRETIAKLVEEGALDPASSPEQGRSRLSANSPWKELIIVPTAGSTTHLLPNGALSVAPSVHGDGVLLADLQEQPILRQSYEWRLVIEASGLDVSQYQLWKRLHADDIYTTLYMDELRTQFPKVFCDPSLPASQGQATAAHQPLTRVDRRSSM